MKDAASPDRIGPYRLLHQLGAGGVGRVYAAVHEGTNQRVALKLLSTDSARDPQTVARFVQEARALAQLEHPGVVRILHSDQESGTAFFTMELLEGIPLRDWIRRGPVPTALHASLAIGAQIAAVLADVHARGVVHRDLKPENVFLCPDESVLPGYRIKLLDFGIAKVSALVEQAADGATLVHTQGPILIGTPIYMAPEQFRGPSAVDGQADVYALGVVLYEMLAGRTPFASKDIRELVSMHARDEPPPLKELAPAVPAALSAFVSSMLAKDPAERPTMPRCREVLGRPWESDGDACPVPGLAHFTESQAELFFGRKAETTVLLDLLEEARTGSRRWVQLEGPSGVGKSSLVYAGVLPRLKELTSKWLVAVMRPSDEPLRTLARSLVAIGAGPDQESVEQALRAGPGALQDVAGACTSAGQRLLLVVEQAEELFTLGAAESSQFDELVSTALAAEGSTVRLFTSIRSDFLHRLERLPRLARLLNEARRYHLQPMEEEGLSEVIQGMARHAGLRLSEGLARRMVADARGEGGRLPLLGQALRALWALSGGGAITHEHYDRLGGVGGALATQAEGLLDGLGADGRERAKWLLLELVQIGRGVPDTRRPRSRDEVVEAAGSDRLAEEVLLRLTGSATDSSSREEQQGLRILTLSGEAEPSGQQVELVHEALLQKVPSLARWVEEERVSLERREDLQVAAHAWQRAGSPANDLPTGTLLAHYRGGLSARGKAGHPADRFLRAAEKLERRRAWIRRGIVASWVAASVAIIFSAFQAERNATRAENNLKQVIETGDELVGDSDWKLSRLAGTLEIRREMLDAHFGKLSSLSAEDRQRPEVRLAIIKTLQRRADLAFHDETLQAAEALLRKAEAEIRSGMNGQPEDVNLREQLALNRSKLGKVTWARGREREARGHFAESVRLLESAPALERANPESYRRTLAVSYTELADVEDRSQNLDRAIQLFEQNGREYNESLLAEALGRRGESASRESDLRLALELARASLEAEGNLYYRWILAGVLVSCARFEGARGQRAVALQYLQEAEALGNELLQGEPENKRYAIVLAEALRELEMLATEEHAALHARRCEMIQGMVEQDGEDERLKRLLTDCGARK